MIEPLDGMPDGTVGFRARGHVTRDDYAWKRTAVVTDVDWIKKAIQMFTWLTPGEVEVFELDQLDEAKAWVAG